MKDNMFNNNMFNKIWIVFALVLFLVVGSRDVKNTKEKLTPEQIMEQLIVEAIENSAEGNNIINSNHSKNNDPQHIIKSISVVEGNLYICLEANKNLPKDLILPEILTTSVNIFRNAFAHELDSAEIIWELPLGGPQDNVHKEPVVMVNMTAEKAKSINWDNLTFEKLPKVADYFWQHPSFN